jgi:transglutaminase-like putative cysteine protease
MLIRAGYEITQTCPVPTAMTTLLSVRPERFADLVTPQSITATASGMAPVPLRQFEDIYGNVGHRLTAPAGPVTLRAEFLIRDSGMPDPVLPDAEQHEVADLPDDVLIYLLGSRYCETDVLSATAWSLFGATPTGWRRVQAIVDYVHDRLTFGYDFASPTRTAVEAHRDRRGVCRDFAHLAVALCRCMNIPARYCTGYLGDIGIPPFPSPMDFSAWFEVWLSGGWRTFDARHNTPRIGRIPMAYGRDAADVAITTAFGASPLIGFSVITEEVADDSQDMGLRRYG